MKQSKKEMDINHNADALYDIVLKIEEYSNYIPWCSKIEILKKNKKEILANMIVNYKLFPTQKFTSKVVYDSKKKIIKTSYIEGPLKDLYTSWEFVSLNNKKY